MSGPASQSRRVLISIIAVLAVVAGSLATVAITGHIGRPAHPAGRVTSMAALAPQLLAKPGADPVTGAARQPACTPAMLPAPGAALAAPGRDSRIAHDGATVALGGRAVRAATPITGQSLCAGSMAPMDQGMTDVTAGPRRGYRFLPHMNFGAKLRITLPYDPALIPAGMSARDVRTFYYDTKLRRWQALPLLSADTRAHTVTSSTTHFTDFTLGTISVPDAPGTLNNNPTSIKDIKAADPGSGVNLIDQPQASSDGAAHLSYPIQLPQGRRGQEPSVSLTYDSSAPDGGAAAADGWLGLGWNLTLPAVEVNTQWGVPRYDPANESETYMMNGAELTPVANRGALLPRTAEKVFHSRSESSFLKIVRHGDSPKSYWWEVTSKDGTRYFYGGDPAGGPDPAAELTDGSGDVFRWALKETEDLTGNTVHYSYAHVSDPGIPGGTVAGTNLYPASINYTGTGDAAGAYTVTFTRDRDLPGYQRRPDVSINGKGGFLLVTADLLKQIDVTFNGQPVRGYQLGYQAGAFGKTLLQSITQLGADGTAFNTHTFSYYDDAQDAHGNYNGFSPATQVSTGNDNVTAGLFGQGQASALSGSESTSIGGHLYAGFNPTDPTKQFSAGGKVGFTETSTDGVLAMIDLNGDGKPDKAFISDGHAFFRLNTTAPGGPVTFADQATALPTLPAISHTSSDQFSAGAEAYFGANVFTNVSQEFTTNDTYFQDVNGDGLPDLVANGQVLFNHLDANGVPTFTANSADSPVPVGGGTVDTSGIGVTPVQGQASANDPLVDTLRVWTAPYTGTIAITGDAALIRDTSTARAQYAAADGVRVAIQQNGTELWNATIGPNDYAPHSPAGVSSLSVTAGDRVYFRVQSVNDGKYDQVSWDPVIAYQGVTPATDVNGLDVYTFHASRDFALAGRRGALVAAPLDGTVHVTGTFHKAGPTTDDVTVEVLKNGAAVFSQTMPAAQTGDIPVSQDIQVSKGDTLALREKIDSPIDVTRLSWAPQLFYASSPSATVTDADGNPLIQLKPPVDTDVYPADDLNGTVQQAWTAPSSGTVHVSPQLSAGSGANGTVTFTVKRQGALVFKEPVTVSGGQVSGDPSFDLPVSSGDQLYFDFSAADPALAGKVSGESVQVDGTTVPSALHSATAINVLPGAFHGWAYAGYNGDGDRATQPIVESDLTQTFSSSSQYDPRTAKAYALTPSPADGEWLGPNSSITVRPGQTSTSRLGAPSLTMPVAGDFAGARAPGKVSDTFQTAVGGGISFLSGSADSGSTTSDVDYLDMNGSGFPAVVSNGHVQYPDQTGALQPGSVPVPGLGDPRSVNASSANVGVGGSPAHFEANGQGQVDNAGHAPADNTSGSQMVDLGLSGSLGSGDSHPQRELLDVNGDGLPDVVTREGGTLKVALNVGYSFAPAEPWGTAQLGDGASENGSIGASLGFNSGIYDFAGGVSLSKNKSQTSEELISMTGSGLPDRVINTPSGMQVAFNTGTGFAPPVPWPGAPDGACADSTSVGLAGIDWNTERLCNGNTSQGAGAYFTVGIGPLCLAACYLILNPGADGSQSMAREEGVLRDVTGSGAPDYVSSTSDGQMTVSLNNIGRTNLLKSVSRPLGATITLDYQRAGGTYALPQQRWVMSHVTVDPGSPSAALTQQATYEYAGGVYNRLERTFYGFGTVTEHQLDTAHGDAVYRTTVREYDTSSYYTHGLPLRTRLYDAAGSLFTDTQQTYETRDVLTGADPADTASTTATIFPMLVRTDERFFEGGATAGKATFTTQHYDALGNVDSTTDAGDPGSSDDVISTTTYGNCPDTNLSAPASITVASANGTVLRHREQTVDCATGEVNQVRQFLADGTVAATDMTYFPDGMLASVTNPANASGQRYRLSYTYDPTVGTYIDSTTDSFGLTSTAAQDLRFGTTQSATDINNNTTSYTVDQFGRTTSVTGPYQQGSGIATITFEYHSGAAIPWAITRHADVFRGPGATIDTVTFIDGLKRVVQTKKSATVFTGAGSAPQDVLQVSGQVTFDPFGRTVAVAYPTTEPLGTAGTFDAGTDPVQPTRLAFDVLDRNTLTTLPDGTSTRTQFGFGPDRSGTTQFKATVTDANGHQKVTFHNARELLTGQEQFHGGTPVWTSYTYDPVNELTSVTDDKGKVTTEGYDTLGRRTDVTNPDSGDTRTAYDLAGNQVATITPNLRAEGKQITFGYDFGRLVSIQYPDNPGNNVTYTYGAPATPGNGAGRVIQVTDGSGTLQRAYGKLGEVINEARTVNTLIGAPVKPTYITQYTYDTFGRLQAMVYPDGEALTYHYDSGGNVNQVTGTKGINSYTYVSRLEYDKFGSKAYIRYGNGVTSSYTYNPLNRRLAGLQSAPAGGSNFQDISYTYDNVGNLTALANNIAVSPNGGNGGPTTQQFGYDDLDRLTSASGTYSFAPGKQNTFTLALSYDSVGNLLEKNQVDLLIQPSGKAKQEPATYDNTYQYNGVQEHAPTHIGTNAYSYDANGNQAGNTADNSGQRQTITWNEANQVQSLSNNGQETDYVYDASGDRIIKRGALGETVYVNQYFTIRNNQIGTKQVIVGNTLIAEKMVDHDQNVFEAKQYFFQQDQIGSSNYVTDANGNVFEHNEYFPTGETWVQEASDTNNIPFQFAGKPFDPESGFYYMGARYYNPVTGIFESPDPALVRRLADLPEDPSKPSGLDTFAAGFLDLYNYADDQPLTKVDPDGQQAVPLTTFRLRTIASAAGIGAGLTGIQFNRAVGRAFQEFANNALGLTENFITFQSPARAAATGGKPSGVIPDAVRNITKLDFSWGIFPEVTTYPRSSFFEVKAVNGVLSLGSSQSQILGLIDVAARSPAGSATGPDRVFPTLTFITTANTVIGPDVIAEATKRGVALWQVIAYEVPAPVPGGAKIGFYPAVPLNPSIFPKGSWLDPYVPVPPVGGAAPGTLGPASGGGPPQQPDPVIVE